MPCLDKRVPPGIPSPADLWDLFCLPMAPGSGPTSFVCVSKGSQEEIEVCNKVLELFGQLESWSEQIVEGV